MVPLCCTQCPWLVQGDTHAEFERWRRHLIEEHDQDPMPQIREVFFPVDAYDLNTDCCVVALRDSPETWDAHQAAHDAEFEEETENA